MTKRLLVSGFEETPTHVKAIRKSFKGSLLPNLGLLPAKQLVSMLAGRSGPTPLVDGVSAATAERIAEELTAVGIETSISPSDAAVPMIAMVGES